MSGAHDDGWGHQVAVVTGAAGDIGREVVEQLLARGVAVAGADLRPSTEEDPGGASGRYRFDLVDLTDPRATEEWVASVVQEWGVPTIGVLSTGVSGNARLVDTSPEEWHRVLGACLDAAFFPARAVIRAMIRGGVRGRVVTIGSWAAHAPHPHIGAYSVAKAGLRMLTQTLALDHAADGILVNEVAPGIVEAGLSKALLEQDPALKQRTEAAIPLGRTLLPAQVARDVLHLASPQNLVTTGAVIVSDGGLSLASVMNPGRSDG
ncbi:SDR family oxidoreductase [Amnibacterium sp. CER49]|uniref:SDR family NAD(P)-dependent oxidoreductase n=1 Tax=Amnibacterium sp. CER49 TaxID=3039161 RepID=UPI0024484A8A|nr:SDR family oxidoreductase [Amnibacterium sp. CER49]MDH2443338.1 SDR family oxidoreductase [Amnibacterium sp. CER49]